MRQQLKIILLLLVALALSIFLVPLASLFYSWTIFTPFGWRLTMALIAFLLLCLVLIMGYRQQKDRNYVLYYATLLFMLALTPRLIYSVAFG